MKKTYELWALGYSHDDMISDYEEFLGEFKTKTQAVNYIKENREKLFTKEIVDEDVATIHVQLEEVVHTKDSSEAVDIIWEDDFSV